jgi:micrococcal nuclease
MSAGAGDSKLVVKIILLIAMIFGTGYVYELDRKGMLPFDFPSEIPNTVGTFYYVDRVVDGDTIKVKINDTVETVRLIGINTPETVDPRRTVECFGKEASSRMKELLDGEIVRLEYDASQNYRDTYDRILAYVYLEDGQMVNRKMIAEGYAYEYTYMTPYLYQDEFRKLQQLAKSSGRGLWSENTCNGEKKFPQ